MMPMKVHALKVARPTNATATLADLLQMQTQIDQAQQAIHCIRPKDRCSCRHHCRQIQIQSGADPQADADVENSLADLMTLNHTINGNIQKLTNASAGRDAPIEKKAFVFRGKCFNCEKEGH